MTSSKRTTQYFDLTIEASSPATDIWLADTDGHLVQKETGLLRTSILAGEYVVEFQLGGPTYPIQLQENQRYIEAELRTGPTCPRPEVRFVDGDEF